jgi:membrane protease YdiL (CAAX protease family)
VAGRFINFPLMNIPAIPKPLISAGWLRVIIFCTVYLLLILSGVLLMSAAIHHFRGETADVAGLMKGELLWAVILMSFTGSLLITYSFRRWVDRKSFLSLGLRYRNHGTDMIAGVTLAVSILGLATLILRATGHLKWMDILFDGKTLMIALGDLALVAFYEEIIFRGYILNNLLESFNKWIALFISAVLFTLFHLGNPGFDFLSVLNLFAIGTLLGLNYLYTRNLWFPICFHFAWNFLEGPILGYPVSGIHFETLLQTEMKGDENITGGTFGLEGSVIILVLCILAIFVHYFMLQKKAVLPARLVPDPKQNPLPKH